MNPGSPISRAQKNPAAVTGRPTDRPPSTPIHTMPSLPVQTPAASGYGHERHAAPAVAARHPSTRAPERRRGRGPGQTGLRELLDRLSGRDLAILDLIGDHRFLTSTQVERFCFHNHATTLSGSRTCRRVLGRLERWHLLERPIRRVGGLLAGSASSIWMLTSTGQRLRNLRRGVGAVGKVRPPGERFIGHYLAIADTELALVEAERAGQAVITTLTLEPACWRHHTGFGGSREILKPDLFAVTAPSPQAEYEDYWFIEIDRGTESLPTILKQCRAYETYRASGTEQTTHGVFPLVVWVVPDPVRAAKLSHAIHAARGLDSNLHRVTIPDDLLSLIRGGAA